jgi:aminomethyltransferase
VPVRGLPMVVSRTGYTGEDGFEIFVEPEFADDLWSGLLETGAEDGLVPAGLGARDTLRLEAGMALYGHEIDATTTPFEAALEWTVKLDKGEFMGRSALLAQRNSGGPHRRLVGFEIGGRGIAREGAAVWVGGEPVGKVTSGTWSPTFEKALGLAYVPLEMATPGTELEIEVRGKRLPAVVVTLPFYRRPKRG